MSYTVDRFGVAALRDVSVNAIEIAIANALAGLVTDREFEVTVHTLDFGTAWTAPLKLAISVAPADKSELAKT